MLVTPNPRLPILRGVVNHPVFAPDGSLQMKPGYSADTRLIYSPPEGFKLPKVSDAPTPAEIAEAKRLLREELLGDFPYTGEQSEAHAIAALLLPLRAAHDRGADATSSNPQITSGHGSHAARGDALPSELRAAIGDFNAKPGEERRRTLFAMLAAGRALSYSIT
jgi:hypothetical protein